MRELWEHLQHVLLLGTGRTSLSEKAKQQFLQLGLSNKHRSENLQLLDGLSLVHFLKRGASRLPKLNTPPPKAPGETGKLPSPQLSRLVERMLSNEDLRPILFEYIEYSSSLDLVLPPEALPYLFDTYQQDMRQMQLLKETMGQRGEWLARQNPVWAVFSQQFDAEIWQYGLPEERLAYFSGLRQNDPEAARTLLEEDWSKESRIFQLQLLDRLRQHISPADTSFLKTCLLHPDQSIRVLAAKLYMQLPGSEFFRKIEEAFQIIFQYDGNAFRLNEQEQLPDLPFLRNNKERTTKKQGGMIVRFLIRIAPPAFWEKLGDQSSDQAFMALQSASFYPKYREEFAEAIHWHQDIRWMRHFIPAQYGLDKSYWEGTAIERLVKHLPYEVFADLSTHYVQFHNDLIDGHSLVYTMLLHNTHFWPASLSQKMVAIFQDYLRYSKSFLGGDEASHYEALLYQLALKSDTALLISLQAGWPQDSFNWYRWERAVKKMLNVLSFRAKMQEAFGEVMNS